MKTLMKTAMKTIMKSSLCALAALFLVPTAQAAKLNTPLFEKQSVVTVSGTTGYTGSTDLSNFPVLVKLSAGAPSGFVYADCATDGSDLRFADASGNLLPHEIDTWNATGTSMVWVCVSTLAHGADTTFTMYYGTNGVSALPAVAASDVWTAAGYNAVWHFDSSNKESVHNLSATSSGTVEYRNRSTYPTIMGGGAMWLKNNGFLEYANSADWTTLGDGNTLTLSCWAISESPSYGRMISSKNQWNDAAGYELTTQGSDTKITVGSSGTTGDNQVQLSDMPSVKSWRHITATYASDGTLSLWVDGVNKGSGPKTKVELKVPTSVLTLGSSKGGGNYWLGGLDEVRIHRGVESDDWIKACYDTMTSATFAVPAAVTYVDPSVTVLVAAFDDPVKNAGNDTIDFGWAVTSVSSANPSTDVKFVYRASGSAVATTNNVTTITAADSGTYQFTLPDANEIYDCQMLAMDAEDIVASTVWKDVGWLVSSKLNGTTSASMTNAKGTFTSQLTTLGTGTTTVTLYVGQDENNLTAVSNYTVSAVGSVSFEYQLNAAGTWYAKIGCSNTDGTHNWSDATTVESFSVSDSSTYTTTSTAGDWTNPACWTTTGEGGVGYPTFASTAIFTDGADITLVDSVTVASLTLLPANATVVVRGSGKTLKSSSINANGANSTLTLDGVMLTDNENYWSVGKSFNAGAGSTYRLRNGAKLWAKTIYPASNVTFDLAGGSEVAFREGAGSEFDLIVDDSTFYMDNQNNYSAMFSSITFRGTTPKVKVFQLSGGNVATRLIYELPAEPYESAPLRQADVLNNNWKNLDPGDGKIEVSILRNCPARTSGTHATYKLVDWSKSTSYGMNKNAFVADSTSPNKLRSGETLDFSWKSGADKETVGPQYLSVTLATSRGTIIVIR